MRNIFGQRQGITGILARVWRREGICTRYIHPSTSWQELYTRDRDKTEFYQRLEMRGIIGQRQGRRRFLPEIVNEWDFQPAIGGGVEWDWEGFWRSWIGRYFQLWLGNGRLFCLSSAKVWEQYGVFIRLVAVLVEFLYNGSYGTCFVRSTGLLGILNQGNCVKFNVVDLRISNNLSLKHHPNAKIQGFEYLSLLQILNSLHAACRRHEKRLCESILSC